MLPVSDDKEPIPSVTIKGTYSKGTLEKADTKPPRETSKIILIMGGVWLFLFGALLSGLMKKIF